MKKLTHHEYVESLHKIQGNKLTILSTYLDSRTKLTTQCNVCKHMWNVSPRSLLRGHGCPECGKLVAKNTIKHSISTDGFMKKLQTITDTIELLDDYVRNDHKLRVKCKTCGNQWITTPSKLMRKHFCYTCGHVSKGLKHRTLHSEYEMEIKKYHNGTIELLSTYIKSSEPITYKCNVCNTINTKCARVLRRRGCNICNLSKGELRIKTLLQENSINYKPQYSFSDLNNGRLKFDFGILDNNDNLLYLIEYDGHQHFKPISYFGGMQRFNQQMINDKLKTDYCISKGIKLIRIHYSKYCTLQIHDLLLN